jgi:AraC-like DNA-binding protein
LSDIAFENGYADQSHYVRAFKEFTNITPKDYLKFAEQG